MNNLNIQCVLAENATPIQKHQFKKYSIYTLFKIDNEVIEKNWLVYSKSVFEADKWANLLIEKEAGSLKGAKKRIEKIK